MFMSHSAQIILAVFTLPLFTWMLFYSIRTRKKMAEVGFKGDLFDWVDTQVDYSEPHLTLDQAWKLLPAPLFYIGGGGAFMMTMLAVIFSTMLLIT